MSFKTFIIGMFVSFGLAWVFVIVIPVAKMGNFSAVKMSEEEDAGYYQHKTSGRILNGAEIYGANGCYSCHSQVIRPTYLGSQIWRKGAAGATTDTVRESSVDDYAGEKYAQIGLMRMGPDLSNFGYRAETYATRLGISPEHWVIKHLYNPRNSDLRVEAKGNKLDMSWSNCPAQLQMFDEIPINGQQDDLALDAGQDAGMQIIPAEQARVLTAYLLSLKRDDAVPTSMNYRRDLETE